jgi:hypothetical protein
MMMRCVGRGERVRKGEQALAVEGGGKGRGGGEGRGGEGGGPGSHLHQPSHPCCLQRSRHSAVGGQELGHAHRQVQQQLGRLRKQPLSPAS